MKLGSRTEPAGPSTRKWSSVTAVLNGWSSSSRQPGSSRSMPIGSTTAPDRICAPTSAPFSSTTTESSGLICFSRIAAARPAGPAPTITTSNSMLSRSLSPSLPQPLLPRLRALCAVGVHKAYLHGANRRKPDFPPWRQVVRGPAGLSPGPSRFSSLPNRATSSLVFRHAAASVRAQAALLAGGGGVAARSVSAERQARAPQIPACSRPAPIPSPTSSAASHHCGVSGSGTKDDPIVITEELEFVEPGDAGHPRQRPDRAVHAERRCANGITYMRIVVLNNSGQAWSRVRVRAAGDQLHRPSTFGDGLSFDQRRSESGRHPLRPLRRISDRDFEPYDRLLFLNGKVDPGRAAPSAS